MSPNGYHPNDSDDAHPHIDPRPPANSGPLSAATAARVGYRELTEEECAAVEDVRAMGRQLEKFLGRIRLGVHEHDKRWLAIATTHMQEGLQACTRAITRPTFF